MKRSFGTSLTGFGPDEAAMALWSTSAEPPCRRNATRTIGGAGCRTQLRRTRKVWQDGSTEQFLLSLTPVCRYRLAWLGKPNFAMSSGEPDAERKSQVRFGKRR